MVSTGLAVRSSDSKKGLFAVRVSSVCFGSSAGHVSSTEEASRASSRVAACPPQAIERNLANKERRYFIVLIFDKQYRYV